MATSNIRPTVTMLMLFTVLFGGIYPLVSTVLVQGIFPNETEGSLIKGDNGEILGSELIGQNFTEPQYFWGRLSATNYNAAASSGSNLGVANPVLLDTVTARVTALKAGDVDNNKPIPIDLVTASASGIDPHISIAAAEYQISRVAKARGVSDDIIRETVQKFTIKRQFGVLGEPRVNVLKLNLALDDNALID
jgi:potassium-transporting ATPase KdpC subunit